MALKYQLVTLGCKVNQYESQQIRDVLHSFGLQQAGDDDLPDLAVVNTCAVTATAARKNRQAVRRAGRAGKTPVIVVGCGASAEASRLRALPSVKAVFGHDAAVCAELRSLLPKLLDAGSAVPSGLDAGRAGQRQSRPDVKGNDLWMNPENAVDQRGGSTSGMHSSPGRILPGPLPIVKVGGDHLTERIESFAGHQRAFLKIQDGCDAYCTYCIIPRLRPRLRSKPVETAVDEAAGLVRAGHKEIILTGIFLGAYGRETAVRKRWTRAFSPLAGLIHALDAVPGLARLRLSSLEPGDVDDALLEALAASKTCVPHLHLPLQSGSDAILRRMNRQYTVTAFREMVDRVRAALDRPAISTDIIVGFPGETDADFESTLDVARFAGFSKIHAFPFSPREGTAAWRWRSDYVEPGEVRERMGRLARLEQTMSVAFRRRFIGETERVIVETNGVNGRSRGSARREEDNGTPTRHVCHGRSDRYFEIHFVADGVRPGDLADVRIDRVTPTRTHGTRLH